MRLSDANMSWKDIAAFVGLSESACAVMHCRAIQKLRVYLFTNHTYLLGGTAMCDYAFKQAIASSRSPLTTDERIAFEEHILRQNLNFRPRGWRASLRAACSKVAENLVFVRSDPLT